MANMGTNTTTTMKKTSVVLAGKCAKTQASLRKLMSDAGCADGETIKVNLPLAPASKDDVVFAGLNGVSFLLPEGQDGGDARGGGGGSEKLRGNVRRGCVFHSEVAAREKGSFFGRDCTERDGCRGESNEEADLRRQA